ncbi:beta-N-acetylhexosaminidase [Siphonobacter sp. BAB-5405]|uniref:family 20 glycosylhydrolase n=1 Tax=Siphonobacter sp. BAB-5405 TaxID=1864825 RepID=UPI000C80B519|nr:family 20 glycosylhydrolase [Siphonobacter sp. BAB-5405]PMD96160.1 beta-N-acetylhexosaminidase [Siphonobacter sp. BAB-5405]
MRGRLSLAFLWLCTLFFVGCKSSEKASEGSSVAISWKLISNFTDTPSGFKARFVFKNNGSETLGNKGWTLYFNMSPRPILASKTPSPATVEHINGDWYKLTPNESFELKPGASLEIPYEASVAIIKETDAPMGLYFVHTDGKEEKIEEVADYTVEPFTEKEQILRGSNDQVPLPTAAYQYQQNAGLSLVSPEQLPVLIPSPVKVTKTAGSVSLTKEWPIYYAKGLANEATFLAQQLQVLTGTSFTTKEGTSTEQRIQLSTGSVAVNGVTSEAYQLNVAANGIQIVGSDAAGVFYGVESLLALAPVAAYQKATAPLALPQVQIEDAPRFKFRSMHFDVCRNFQTKETVKRVLDLLAFYKINHLLFYLTEDEAWRLEIKSLPELTEVGSHRQHTAGMQTAALHPAYGSGPHADAKGKYGSGYYTRQDFIDILKYAQERHIQIIPEIGFPGHSRAAIKSMEARYERFMKEGKTKEAEEFRLIDPEDKSVYSSAQAFKDNVICVARESAYHFFETVIADVAKMYDEAGLKLTVLHVGGDEVPQGVWTKSPMVDELLKKHPEIKGPRYLQSYFFGQMLHRLKKYNLEIHGWEEVALNVDASGQYVANPDFVGKRVVPYIWNNVFDVDLGYRMANAGYPVVLCNVTNLYMDLAYNNDPKEPGLYWGGFVGPKNAWTFAPYDFAKTTYTNSLGKPLDFTGKQKLKNRQNILGLEAQLWSETVKGRDMMEYYVLPKLIGFAESAWAAERPWETIENRDQREKSMQTGWNVFANTLAQRELPRLSYWNNGYNYRIPTPGAVLENGTLQANAEYPGLQIRYTTDGSEPGPQSTLYQSPVPVQGTVKLKCFDSAGKSSRMVTVGK